MRKTFSIRRGDAVALAVLGAFITGVHGAALSDLLQESGRLHDSSAPVEEAAAAAVPAAPEGRLMKVAISPGEPEKDLVDEKPRRAQQVSLRRQPAPVKPTADRSLDVVDVKMVRALYRDLGYGLDAVKAENAAVPRVFLSSVPEGIRQIEDVKERKSLFLRTLLPLVLKANEEIAADRERVRALLRHRERFGSLPSADRRWLENKAREYGLKSAENGQALLRRIDIIPPSLALAQAAEESGWGTSRFARQGNALFGQWTRGRENGIVPLEREPGKTHVVKSFPTLMDAVRAYARNLNVHRAYTEFRNLRADMRQSEGEPAGYELAKTMLRYSERGPKYVETLHVIMRANDLPAFDNARLADAPVEVASLPWSSRTR